MNSAPRSNLKVWTNGQVPGRYYTFDPTVAFGFNNHFQSIQRLRDSRLAVIAGGVHQQKQAHLFLVKLGSKSDSEASGDFGSNLVDHKLKPDLPRQEDRIVRRFDIGNPKHWHAGGIARTGDVIAVALEAYLMTEASEMRFYDFSDPYSPREIPGSVIPRPQQGAVAIGLEKLDDGRFVAVVRDAKTVDIYLSRTQRLEDGFDYEQKFSLSGGNVTRLGGQTVNLVRQCDGRLFLFDLDNTGPLQPVIPGKNSAFIYELSGLRGEVGKHPKLTPKLAYQDRIDFECGLYCNFAATAGVYIGSDQRLRVYAAPYFRSFSGKILRLAEFAE